MRIALVGPPADRARLRAELDANVEAGLESRLLEIVAEYSTLSDARAAAIDVDGILLADETGRFRRRAPRYGGQVASRSTDDDGAIEEPLTVRELEVLELMAEGLTNKRIAERLHISDQTVKFHVAAISGKLGAVNRTDAVRRAVRRGLVAL
jgi:ATP/maltotriose-dependent transcriptional regulator MalT